MKKLFCIFFIALTVFFVPPVFSAEHSAEEMQDSVMENTEEIPDEAEEMETDAKDVEQIKVTGSRITRIDTKGPNPVVIYTKEDLENSGYSSAGDFLRDTTATHFGVIREEAGHSASGGSFTSIKGEASLILINGVRVAKEPTAGYVDLNLIPLYAIERVEVLKDGASAIYGSDAVGGVINFITKKNFSGTEIHGQVAPTIWPLYKGGSRADIATVFGDANNKWSYIGSFHFRFQDSIENSERKWTNKTIATVSPYAVFNGQVDPKCPEELKQSDGCEFNVADYSTRHPQYSQLYGYFQGNYKLNETTLYTQLIASYKTDIWSYAPIPGGLMIPSGHKMRFGQGQEGLLEYRFMEAGKRDSTYNNFIGDLTIGAKGYISPTWDYDTSVKLVHIIKNETEKGLLLKKELKEIIFNGIYDPFNSTKRDLSKAIYTAKSNHDSTLLLGSLNFSGEAGFWDIDLATGLQAYFKNFDQNADENKKEGKILSNAGGDGYGERHVLSYYLEGIKSFSEMLEIQLAGRMDYYNDSVSPEIAENSKANKNTRESTNRFTINPKLALKFKPISQLLFRGSLGTAFVAPSLELLNTSGSESFEWIFDTVACYNELKSTGKFNKIYEQLGNTPEKEKETFAKDFLIDPRNTFNRSKLSKEVKAELKNLSSDLPETEYCKNRQVFTRAEGNKKLKETRAIVASLGSHWQIADDHSLTFDLWYIKKSGVPSSGLDKKTLDAELKYGNDYVKEKSDGEITINRNSEKNYNPLYKSLNHGIKTRSLNLGGTQKTGIDIDWTSDMSSINLFGGNPYFKDRISYILFSKVEGFPGMSVDNIGTFGAPQWRNIAVLGWKNKKHNISITAHTVSSFAKESSELENLPMYTRWDLDYQFAINEKATFKFGWSNLLFSSPPVDEGKPNNKLVHDIFESRGPFFFAGFKYAI